MSYLDIAKQVEARLKAEAQAPLSTSCIAVMVPVHNCLRYTAQFFATLSFGNSDEIVIDNASTDMTQHFITKNMPSVTYVRNPHPKCVAASWNQGLKLAFERGATHVFVANNDIVMMPGTIATLLKWHEKGLEVPTVVAVPGATSTCLKDYVPREQTHKPGDFCGFLVTKFTMDRVGPFDENFEVAYCEDIDWALRAKQKGCIVATCEDAPVFHWGSRTIVEGGVDNGPSFIRNAEYFRRKHGLSYEEARILISM